MKKIKMLFALMLTAALSSMSLQAQDTTKIVVKKEQQQANTIYQCPMKCEGKTFDKPGKCPVCGMTLEKIAMQTQAKDGCSKVYYISPVKGKCPHSTTEVIEDNSTLRCALCYDMAGKWTKCGKND